MPRHGRGQPRDQAIIIKPVQGGIRPDLQGNADAAAATTAKFKLTKVALAAQANAASEASGVLSVVQETVLNNLVTNQDIVRRTNYAIVLYDIVTQTQKDEIPTEPFTYASILNAPGTFTGSIPLDHPKATRENLDPGTTAVYIVREGVIVWGGILDAVKPDWNARKLTYSGTGWLSAFNRRFLHGRHAMQFASAAGTFTYRPTGDTIKTNVVGYPDNTGLFNNVDEPDPPNLTDYIMASAQVSAYEAKFPIQAAAFAGLTIASVRVTALISSLTGFTFVSPWLTIGATDYTVPTFTRAPNYGVAICSATWSNNPATGVGWTPADVAAFASADKAGVRIVQPFDVQDTIVWQLWVDVTWEANPSGAIFWDDAEQLEIIRDMVRHTQAEPGGDLHFALDGSTSGVHRTQHSYSWEYKQVGTLMSQLSKLDHGFDYAVTTEWDLTHTPPRPKNTFRLYYPKRGARIPDVRFDRNNLLQFTMTTDGTKIANRVDVVGTGSGSEMLTATRSDSQQWTDKPLWEKVLSQKTIDQQASLDALAEQNLQLLTEAQELPAISVRPDPVVAPVGTFQVGDEIEVFLDEGYIQIDKIMRVQRIDVSVDANLNEVQKVTFADVIQTDTADSAF